MLWHAFQHTATDVRSCYQAVLGREPPFTRFTSSTTPAAPRKCVDYIFCSGEGLSPQQVLLPPCRNLLLAGLASSQGRQRRADAAIDGLICSAAPSAEATTAVALATRIGIVEEREAKGLEV